MERVIRSLTWPLGDGTVVEPDYATEAGRRMNFAGQDVTALRDNLGSKIDTAGSAKPWGADSIGAAFQENYAETGPLALQIWRQVGMALEQMGTNIRDASQNTVTTDQANAQRVDRAGAHLPDIPL